MKKLVLAALIVLGIAAAASAEIITYTAYTASAGTVTVNIPAVNGQQTSVVGIELNSDLSTATLAYKLGATTGSTTNYTVKGYLGSTSGKISTHPAYPVLVAPVYTQMQLVATGTTANSLFVTIERK